MAIIQRPTKQGNATTYQGKVAAGYTKILASEVDADLDLIYSAWNQGVDTVNIADGSITAPKLAPGQIGTRELQDGGVKLVDLNAEVKTAGGDLLGQYPNPTVLKVSGGTLYVTPRCLLQATQTSVQLYSNHQNSTNYDVTKPAWFLRLDYTADNFEVWRAPIGSPTYTRLFYVDPTGKLLPGGGTVGARQHVAPTPVSITTYNVSVLVYTLPAITTRGGAVHLFFNHSLYYTSSATAGSVLVATAIYRNGTSIVTSGANIGSGGAQVVTPVPPITWVDNVAAGTYTYDLRILIGGGTSATIVSTQYGDLVVQEVG